MADREGFLTEAREASPDSTEPSTNPGANPSAPGHRGAHHSPGDNPVIAAFGFDPCRTWPFMVMLLVLIALGVARIVTEGIEGQWLGSALLIGFPVLAVIMVGAELRMRGPILLITEKGLLDRRQGPDLVPWDEIEFAEVKLRPFLRNVRVLLRGGRRYDIELMLVQAQPDQVLALIEEQASRGRTPPRRS